MAYTEHSYLGLNSQGFHNIVYNDWGPKDKVPLICVHGITCNGHDFDPLANHLSTKGHRLITLDLAGRGRSDNLPNPLDYNIVQYNQDIAGLIAHLGFTEPNSVDFLGISLGGMIGICLAGVQNSPIRRFIINDVGPVVPQEALNLIANVVLQPRSFDTVEDLEQDLRTLQRIGWGPITEEIWHHMAEHNARALDDGSLTYNYDPDIVVAFKAASEAGGGDLWPFWDNIQCPTMLVRGEKSVILPEDLLQEMLTRGPGPDVTLATFEDCGHAPSLTTPVQIEAIEEWLRSSVT